MTRRIASLFAGIGGLELGLERAQVGRTTLQVEIDPLARQVLAKHWPHVRREANVRTIESVDADLVCAGFPCQDLSDASRGRGGGLHGARSGLWTEVIRIVEASPGVRHVIVENTAGAAWKQWVPQLRRELHRIGFASVPLHVRACDVGAFQRGARVFVAATAYSESEPVESLHGAVGRLRAVAAQLSRRPWGPVVSRGSLAVANGLSPPLAGLKPNEALRLYGNAVVPRMAEAVGWAVFPPS